MRVESCVECPLPIVLLSISCERDEKWLSSAHATKSLGQMIAIHIWHGDIRDYDLWIKLLREGQCRTPIVYGTSVLP